MNTKVQCLLCPFKCVLNVNERGVCQVRVNKNGKLISLVYARPATMHIDPIEKKPMFHFYPGTKAFSIATAGCNLGCKFCQNWQLSQAKPENLPNEYIPPSKLVEMAQIYNSESIAYTYNEPIIFYEYVYDTSILAKQKNIKNILVSAGFINPEPMKKLAKVIDGANIDLKGFSEEYYQKVCFGALKPVLKTLEICLEENVILEITNLIVPTLNDDFTMIKNMVKWIRKNLGDRIPLHFSRFYPMYKLTNLIPTPSETLVKARKIAMDEGLKFVYIGNVIVPDGESTFCPSCQKKLVDRYGYTIKFNKIKNGQCPYCHEKIYGEW